MAKHRALKIGATVPVVQMEATDAVDNPINVSGPDVFLGRITSGEGGHEELTEAGITEETTPAAGDFLVGFVGGAIRKMDVGNLPGGGETVISPSSLSTDQNNWNPTSLSTATAIRITSSVNLLMITGITAPAAAKKLALTNIGTNTFILTAQDANSSAANRFQFGKDVPIYPGHTVTIAYDLTTAVWRLHGLPYEHKFLTDREVSIQANPLTPNAIYGIQLFPTTGNSVTAPTATDALRLNLAAPGGAGSWYALGDYTGSNVQYFYSSSSARISAYTETILLTPANLSDATNSYSLAAGFLQAVGTSEPQGMSIFYTHSQNSGKWMCFTKGAGNSTADSGITVAVSTKYKLAVQARPDNSVVYFINDVLVGKTTTNMPTQALWAGANMVRLAGAGRSFSVYGVEARQIR